MPDETNDDLSALREALKYLRTHNSTESIIAEIFGAKPTTSRSKERPISVSHLNKFISNDPKARLKAPVIAKLTEFASRNCPDFSLRARAAITPGGLGFVLTSYFANSKPRDTFTNDDFQTRFIGKYALYRPNWRNPLPTAEFRVSMLDIEKTDDGVRITETQDFPDEDPPFKQHDVGSLFPCGPYGYWLMKQQNGGTRVSLGVIERAYPHPGEGAGAVDWFEGALFAASYIDIFPQVRFFCIRCSSDRLPKFGVMKLDFLRHPEARKHLELDQPVSKRGVQ